MAIVAPETPGPSVSTTRTSLSNLLAISVALILAAFGENWVSSRGPLHGCFRSTAVLLGWSLAQIMPLPSSVGQRLNRRAWENWECSAESFGSTIRQNTSMKVPVVDVQEHKNDPSHLLSYLQSTYGSDWRKRPLLLRRLWHPSELHSDRTRRLSLAGLLNETLEIPYFTNARKVGALSPDGRAPVKDVVAGIVHDGRPFKIGTQLVVQSDPELVNEVAPPEIMKTLFGNYFTPDAVRGTGPFQMLPALTTVPLFVAWKKNGQTFEDPYLTQTDGSSTDSVVGNSQYRVPHTALHCEPIGNVAVQLSGKKEW